MLFIVFIFFFLRVHYCHICNMHILFIAVECTCSHFTITNLIEESSCSLVLFIHSQDVCLCFEPTQYTQNIDHKNPYRFQLPFGILMYQQCIFFFVWLDLIRCMLNWLFISSSLPLRYSPCLFFSWFLCLFLPFSFYLLLFLLIYFILSLCVLLVFAAVALLLFCYQRQTKQCNSTSTDTTCTLYARSR